MKKQFHYVYQITNLVNNKIYIGVHQTYNLDDGYKGSGLQIIRAIQKYGENNFKKDILFFFDSREESLAKEAEIVNEDFLKRKDTYNIVKGGVAGTAGMIKYTNGKCDTYYAKGVKPPKGFYPGSCLVPGTFNKSPYTDGKTIKYFGSDDKIPEGFQKGTCQKNGIKDKKGYTNGKINIYFKENEEIPKEFYPGNYQKGSLTVYTNGIRNTKIQDGEEVPEGFWKGFTGGLKDKAYYNNGKTNILLDKNETPPKGFKKGMLKSKTTKNSIWITNGDENFLIPKNQDIPEGFRLGQIHYSKYTKILKTNITKVCIIDGQKRLSYCLLRDKEYWNNGDINVAVEKGQKAPKNFKKGKVLGSTKNTMAITNEVETRFVSKDTTIPEGWEKGTSQKGVKKVITKFLITDGKENRSIPIGVEVPEGWRRGMTSKGLRGKIRITNGVINKNINKEKPIPEGWYKGITYKHGTKDKLGITNGRENKYISGGIPIPEGWRKGITRGLKH